RRRALLLRLRSAHPLPRQRSAALADHQQRREERIPAAPAGLVRSSQPLALRALVATELVDQASAAGGGAAPARPQKRRRATVERFGHWPAGARPQRPAAGDSSAERRWLSANGISRRELKAQACNRSAPPPYVGAAMICSQGGVHPLQRLLFEHTQRRSADEQEVTFHGPGRHGRVCRGGGGGRAGGL